MYDYHIHTNLSDGKNTHEEILDYAVTIGVKEIGFSDHLCLRYPSWAVKEFNFDLMIRKVQDIKNNRRLPFSVKFGLEVDYFEDCEKEILEVMQKFPIDYSIGSVHFINDWNFDTSVKSYEKKDIDQFYRNYYSLLQKAAMSGLFEVMGHIDLAKKFGFYPSFDLNPIYEKTAYVFSKANVAIELNTSGRDKPCKEFYPSDNFLKHCFEKNIPVTLGSDTHEKSNLTRYFDEAIRKLKTIGYTKLATYTNRKCYMVQI